MLRYAKLVTPWKYQHLCLRRYNFIFFIKINQTWIERQIKTCTQYTRQLNRHIKTYPVTRQLNRYIDR